MKELTDLIKAGRQFCCGGKADVHDNIDARKYLAASQLAVFPDEFFLLVKYINGIRGDFAEVYAIDPAEDKGFTDAVRANERLDRKDADTIAVLGENSFDYLVFDTRKAQYQMRDKEDDTIIARYSSLDEALRALLKISV